MGDSNEAVHLAANEAADRLGVLTKQECIELIKSTPIGRIGFWVDLAPLVLPVNFAWADDGIVFRTVEGQKMAAAADEQAVCFEADSWDEHRTGWSVVVRGFARVVTDWAEIEQLEQLGLVPWAKDQWRTIWVRIEPVEITGRILR